MGVTLVNKRLGSDSLVGRRVEHERSKKNDYRGEGKRKIRKKEGRITRKNDENLQGTERTPELAACIDYWLRVINESAPFPSQLFSGPFWCWAWPGHFFTLPHPFLLLLFPHSHSYMPPTSSACVSLTTHHILSGYFYFTYVWLSLLPEWIPQFSHPTFLISKKYSELSKWDLRRCCYTIYI